MSEKDQMDSAKNRLIERKQSLKEKAKKARQGAYQKAKEQRKKYLATPEIQAKLQAKRDSLKQRKKQQATAARTQRTENRKIEKKHINEAIQQERINRQNDRDQELKTFVKPALTLLKGGADTATS